METKCDTYRIGLGLKRTCDAFCTNAVKVANFASFVNMMTKELTALRRRWVRNFSIFAGLMKKEPSFSLLKRL